MSCYGSDDFENIICQARHKYHALFIQICYLALEIERHGNEDLASRILLQLVFDSDTDLALFDTRKEEAMLDMRAFFARQGCHRAEQFIYEKLAEISNINTLTENEALCQNFANSLKTRSNDCRQTLNDLWLQEYGAKQNSLWTIPLPACFFMIKMNVPKIFTAITKYLPLAERSSGILGLRAIHVASFMGCANILDTLLDSTEDVDVRDQYRRTALFIAASMGHRNCCDVLHSKKANVQNQDRHGHGMAEVAARGGHFDCLKYLVGKGASVGGDAAVSQCIRTPIEAAVDGDIADGQMIQWMMNNGADPQPNASRLARSKNRDDLVQVLDRGTQMSSWDAFPFPMSLNNTVTHQTVDPKLTWSPKT